MDELLLYKTFVSCPLCTMATLPPSNMLLYQANSMLNELDFVKQRITVLSTELNLACSVPHPDSPNDVCVLLNMQGYEYGRSANPSRGVLEACLASLDDAKYALCFASGLGATTAVVHLLNAGDHMISVDDVYGGTYRYFNKVSMCHYDQISQVSAAVIFLNGRHSLHLFLFLKPYGLTAYCLHIYEEVS